LAVTSAIPWVELGALGLFLSLTVGRAIRVARAGGRPVVFAGAGPLAQRVRGVAIFLLTLGWCGALVAHAIPLRFDFLPSLLRARLFDSTLGTAAGLGLTLVAALVNLLAAFALGAEWRMGVARPARLVTGGIYAFSRNPTYLFFGLWFWAAFLVHPTALFLAAAVAGTLLFHFQALAEERFLAAQFGDEYRDYRGIVSRYFGRGRYRLGERLAGGLMAVVGFILSPLSWWNDAFVNLPLAYLFANGVGLISRRLFGPALVVGYWLTNIAGIWLMARGSARATGPAERRSRRRELAASLIAATGYTILVVLLVRFGLLKPFIRPRP
jgi:protein-S-isoprenylcysteine O-methyltransferase Ste14